MQTEATRAQVRYPYLFDTTQMGDFFQLRVPYLKQYSTLEILGYSHYYLSLTIEKVPGYSQFLRYKPKRAKICQNWPKIEQNVGLRVLTFKLQSGRIFDFLRKRTKILGYGNS